MEENTGKSLEKILAKLEGLEAELGRVSQRLNALEANTPEQTDHLEQTSPPVDSTANSAPPAQSIDGILESGVSLSPSPAPSGQTDASQDQPPQNPAAPPPLPTSPQASSPIPAMPLPPTPAVPPAAFAGAQPDVPPGPALPDLPSSISQPLDAVAAYRAQTQRDRVDAPRESLEMRIAGTWLPRIGILVLALVLILFAREHVQGPLGKVVGSYLLSVGLIIAGLFYEKKYPRWGAPVLAGGLAFSYFASYAMGFVEPMRLLDSLTVKLAVLAVNLVAIFGFAQWKRSEVLAGTALVLGYLTTGVVGNDVAAMGSCVALSIVAVVFLWWNQWLMSTAIAAAASYASFIYIQKAVPDAVMRGPGEAFWAQFFPLTLLFLVFSVATWVAVGIVSKARAQHDTVSTWTHKIPAGENIATALAQTNVAAYIAAMVWVLHSTEIYWPRAWVFFFPMVGVCGALAMRFSRVRSVQQVHLIAGAVCLALGIVSAASPMWLPLFLAGQAIAMLLASRRKTEAVWWNALSLLVLIYACAYVTFNGAHGIGWYATETEVQFPWWVLSVLSLLTLGYAVLWEKNYAEDSEVTGLGMLAFFISAMAGFVWVLGQHEITSDWSHVVAGAAVPVGLFIILASRVMSPLVFVIMAIYSSIVGLFEMHGSGLGPWTAGYWIVAGIATAGGYLVEKRTDFSRTFTRLLWSITYLWVQLYLICAIMSSVAHDWRFLVVTGFFAGAVIAGWFFRSAAMAKSAAVPLAMLALGGISGVDFEHWNTLVAIGLLVVSAYPLGLAHWRERTGDTTPKAMGIMQSMAIAVAGWTWVITLGDIPYNVNRIFVAGSWSLIAALFITAGGFARTLWVPFLFALISAIILLFQVMTGQLPAGGDGFLQATHGAQMVWALCGIALIIAAERVINWTITTPRSPQTRWSNTSEEANWPEFNSMRAMSAVLAICTMLMAVVALRLMPELRVFYFTGAMVAVAFVWIVLGFWFREPVYRKSGLILLCGGLVKGLVYDVLSLKNTVYRQISWTVLGVLAIGASFLYNRFRGRVE